MGLFGNDKEQDARIDALESHVRAISEAIQQTQLDVMKVNISLIRTESLLGDKVSSADVDPGIVALNEQLGVAREEYEKMSAAAEEIRDLPTITCLTVFSLGILMGRLMR